MPGRFLKVQFHESPSESLDVRCRTPVCASVRAAVRRGTGVETRLRSLRQSARSRSGSLLANELRREHPHTAVVIATAYTDLLEGKDAPPVADFLVKPFKRERFAEAVDRGRRWRQDALEDVQWHALLSMELKDRTRDICAH